MKINKKYNIENKYLENYKGKKTEDIKGQGKKEGKDVKIDISRSTKKLVNEINKSQDRGFSERVEKIRKSILEGSYTVNSESIADKIMATIRNQKGSER